MRTATKVILVVMLLSLIACKSLEDPPEVWLCQYNGTPRAFYCENTKTKERVKVPADSDYIKAAQCLTADGYQAMQSYMDYLISEAQQRCR